MDFEKSNFQGRRIERQFKYPEERQIEQTDIFWENYEKKSSLCLTEKESLVCVHLTAAWTESIK